MRDAGIHLSPCSLGWAPAFARATDIAFGTLIAWITSAGSLIFGAIENAFDDTYDVGRTPVLTVGLPRAVRTGVRLNPIDFMLQTLAQIAADLQRRARALSPGTAAVAREAGS